MFKAYGNGSGLYIYLFPLRPSFESVVANIVAFVSYYYYLHTTTDVVRGQEFESMVKRHSLVSRKKKAIR